MIFTFVPTISVYAANEDFSLPQTRTITLSGKSLSIDSKMKDSEIALLTSDVLSKFEPEGTMISVNTTTTVLSDLNNNTKTAKDISLQTISTSILTITTIVERVYQKDRTLYDNFKFTVIATWSSGNPIMNLTDKIAMAWSDNFTLYSDSCVNYTNLNPSGTYNGTIRSSVAAEAGISYDIQMKYGVNVATEYSKGCKLTVYVYKNNSSGTANVVGEYAHKTVGITAINASFSSTPNVSFSGGAVWEEGSPSYSDFAY